MKTITVDAVPIRENLGGYGVLVMLKDRSFSVRKHSRKLICVNANQAILLPSGLVVSVGKGKHCREFLVKVRR